jgi:hypothetical protein
VADRWKDLVDMFSAMGDMPTKCTLVLPGQVFEGQVGKTTVDGDDAHIEIGRDTATVSRFDLSDFELSDPVPGYEYLVRVES